MSLRRRIDRAARAAEQATPRRWEIVVELLGDGEEPSPPEPGQIVVDLRRQRPSP